MIKWFFKHYYALKLRVLRSFHYRVRRTNGLSAKLQREGKTRWLDMGASSSFSDNFFFADLYPKSEAKPELKDRYFQFNAASELSDEELEPMGKFDLIRMQHVFEHIEFEDGAKALFNCHRLLNDEGYLLITVPDLAIMVERYRRNCLDVSWEFKDWAESRIEKGDPQSYYFSVFSHSVPFQTHVWCYDKDGLIHALERTGLFKNIQCITGYHPLAEIPFTHNRPGEDVCVLAQKA